MSRVQLALNVANIDESIAFYSKLFATEPAKVRPGYANFAISEPPLKLVLIEDPTKAPGSLNHLGVEVASAEEVASAQARLGGVWHQDRDRGRGHLLLCAAGQGMGAGAGRGEMGVLHRPGRRRDAGGPAARRRGEPGPCCSDVGNETARRQPACC